MLAGSSLRFVSGSRKLPIDFIIFAESKGLGDYAAGMSGLQSGMGEEVNLGKIALEVLALIKGDLAVAISNRGFQIHGGVFRPFGVIEPAGE